ncbi:tape measure protein [Candidatus Pacearchaeota archaeon]|nr:tape measure protein [Candidatus Pacearchaeota archaeon]
MAKGRSIRDLFVRIGFDADDAPLRKIDRGVDSLKGNLRTLRNVLIGTTGVVAGFGFALREAAKFEQTKIAFEVLLGSAERANSLLKDLFETARTTPFLIPQILKAGQQLIALGTPMEEVVDILRMLGNVASGTNTELFLIVDAFSKARATGFLMGEVFRQFRRQGVPITAELEKITGKTGQSLRKMGAAGEITFDLLLQAFKNMTGEGGRFFNLMERQSKTTLGILSNIKDSIIIAAIRIGEGLLPQVKKLEKVFFDFLETNKKIIQIRGKKIFVEIGKGISFAFNIAKDFLSTLVDMTDIVGGLENAIKLATATMFIMFSISMLSGIGNIAIGLFMIAKAFTAIGNAAAIAQIKAFAFPLLVGVALASLGLIIQDIVNAFDPEGKNSLTRLILDNFETNYPRAFNKAKRNLKDFIDTMKLFAKTAKEGLLTPVDVAGKIPEFLSRKAPGAGGRTNLETLTDFFKTSFEAIKSFRLTPISPGESGGGFVGKPPFGGQTISINVGDINVTTPPGADNGEIASTIKTVFEDDILFPAHRSLRPPEVQ